MTGPFDYVNVYGRQADIQKESLCYTQFFEIFLYQPGLRFQVIRMGFWGK